MDDRSADLAQPVPFARLKVYRVAVNPALPQQTVLFVGIEIVPRLRVEAAHPFDFIELFAQMGLHQALRPLRPELPQRVQLRGRRGGREPRRDGIARPAFPVPAVDQGLAVVIGRLRIVLQANGRVAVHAGLARNDPHAAFRRRLENRIDAVGVDGAKARDGGRAVVQRKVEVSRRDIRRIGRIGKPHLFGEGVGIEPVDQPLAPARDDGRLRVMHMRVHEAGTDERIAIGGHRGLRGAGAQIRRRSDRSDLAVGDKDGGVPVHAHGVFPRLPQRVAGEAQDLTGKKAASVHAATILRCSGRDNREAPASAHCIRWGA